MSTAIETPTPGEKSDQSAFFAPHIDQVKAKVIQNKVSQSLPGALKNAIGPGGKIKDSDIPALLQHAKKAEEWLEICFLAEQNGASEQEAIENLWVAGLEKFSGSSAYLESLGHFFYQKGKFHKSLNYLAKTQTKKKSFFIITLSIAAAYAVTQYHLVIDYYNELSTADRKKLNDDMIMKVATAALNRKDYTLSQNLFTYIRERNEASPLPTLEEAMIERFGSMSKMKKWVEETSHKASSSERDKLSLTECITYATALIHLNQFDQALKHIETVKTERFATA